MDCRDVILQNLACRFSVLGKELGFSEPIIRSSTYSTEIYILKKYALQIAVDWREYVLFVYVVQLQNGVLPEKGVLYHYPNGEWCRKFLEDIYHVKNPMFAKKSIAKEKRYTEQFLYDVLDFYINTIRENPEKLLAVID